MKVIFRKKIPDGRYVLVYDDKAERHNIVIVIRSNSIIPDIIEKVNEIDWKEKLTKILGVSKKELGWNNEEKKTTNKT